MAACAGQWSSAAKIRASPLPFAWCKQADHRQRWSAPPRIRARRFEEQRVAVAVGSISSVLFPSLKFLHQLALTIDRFAGTRRTGGPQFRRPVFAVRGRSALGPFDGFFPGIHLNDPKSFYEFPGFGEGAVGDGALTL